MKCKLSTFMGRHRYNIEEVHKLTGISRSSITQLYHDKAKRIDFETVERLCSLFACEIGDLFELEGAGAEGGQLNEF